MTFQNEKKTFLGKLDQSKKGSIDAKVIPFINIINQQENYYTTSSCSGRVYLWKGSGKKNETQWLKVSHDLIDETFFEMKENSGLIWLRLEGFIMHLVCKDLVSATTLLDEVRKIYKKSCILSASNKIIVEIRGSEFMEMPLYLNEKLVFSGDVYWLKDLINEKLERIWRGVEKLEKSIKNK